MSPIHVANSQEVHVVQVFPQEIFDLFIDELKDSPEYLKSFSLVSPSWLPRCQAHLFRHLKVCYLESVGWLPSWSIAKLYRSGGFFSTTGTVKAPRVYPLLSLLSNPAILRCVRNLSLDLRYCIPHSHSKVALEKALQNLAPHLNFCTLQSISLSFPGSIPPVSWELSFLMDLLRKSPLVERLALDSMSFNAVSMHSLLQCMRNLTPRLRCFSFHSVNLREPVDHLQSKITNSENPYHERHANGPPLLAIQELSIGDVDSCLIKALLLPIVPHTFDLDCVGSLTIDCSSSYQPSEGLLKLLERCSSTIKHLTLLDLPETGYGDTNAFLYKKIVSANVRGLTVLELHAVNFHEGRIYFALQHLAFLQCELEELQIRLKYGPRRVFIPTADRALSEFATLFSKSLRCIRIDVEEKIEDFDSTQFMRTSGVVDVMVGVQ